MFFYIISTECRQRYVYKKFGPKQLVELLSALGFASSYSETSILQLSTIVRPEQIVVNESVFLQFIFDNADFIVNTLGGLHTFRAMGGIMVTTPYDSMAPNTAVARVTKCKSSELVRKTGHIELDVYKKGEISGLETVNISDVQSIHSIPDEMLPHPVHLLWLYGTCSINVSLPGWNGFMEGATQGNPCELSRVFCLPFINNPPSQFDTIVTAIRTAKRKCETFNMKTCFVTFDQPRK
ncbi:hypothetical protein AVEN_134774-1 [Araneus ventricosus]|uniref:Uncharacterized protein n=1 Tax=Araneus ventricosus TaxID=182803 RepID=A0A4Y2G922_ARAVE|nr:hypothetical protein AVEN_134774-1 [Araneus ventricosus]